MMLYLCRNKISINTKITWRAYSRDLMKYDMLYLLRLSILTIHICLDNNSYLRTVTLTGTETSSSLLYGIKDG